MTLLRKMHSTIRTGVADVFGPEHLVMIATIMFDQAQPGRLGDSDFGQEPGKRIVFQSLHTFGGGPPTRDSGMRNKRRRIRQTETRGINGPAGAYTLLAIRPISAHRPPTHRPPPGCIALPILLPPAARTTRAPAPSRIATTEVGLDSPKDEQSARDTERR
jgi:hypothetical protein